MKQCYRCNKDFPDFYPSDDTLFCPSCSLDSNYKTFSTRFFAFIHIKRLNKYYSDIEILLLKKEKPFPYHVHVWPSDYKATRRIVPPKHKTKKSSIIFDSKSKEERVNAKLINIGMKGHEK